METKGSETFLTGLVERFANSSFYVDFCSKLPEGLNNAYLDFVILIILLIVIGISIKEFVSGLIWRYKNKKRKEALLKAKAEEEEDIMNEGTDPEAGPDIRHDGKEDILTPDVPERVRLKSKETHLVDNDTADPSIYSLKGKGDDLPEKLPEEKPREEEKKQLMDPNEVANRLVRKKLRSEKKVSGHSGNGLDSVLSDIEKHREEKELIREQRQKEQEAVEYNRTQLEEKIKSQMYVETDNSKQFR